MGKRGKFVPLRPHLIVIVLDRGLMARVSPQFVPRANKIFMEESYGVRN